LSNLYLKRGNRVKMFNLIAFFIVIFGGINWFCIGLFQFDIIAGIFGSQAHFVSRFLYCIIGICAIYSIIALPIKKGRIYEPKKKKQDTENLDLEEENADNASEIDKDDVDEIVITKPRKKKKVIKVEKTKNE
jgi:uncharacterized protein